jgi:hypothetical protein
MEPLLTARPPGADDGFTLAGTRVGSKVLVHDSAVKKSRFPYRTGQIVNYKGRGTYEVRLHDTGRSLIVNRRRLVNPEPEAMAIDDTVMNDAPEDSRALKTLDRRHADEDQIMDEAMEEGEQGSPNELTARDGRLELPPPITVLELPAPNPVFALPDSGHQFELAPPEPVFALPAPPALPALPPPPEPVFTLPAPPVLPALPDGVHLRRSARTRNAPGRYTV